MGGVEERILKLLRYTGHEPGCLEGGLIYFGDEVIDVKGDLEGLPYFEVVDSGEINELAEGDDDNGPEL